ncbi:hypothetical protein [Streptomyces sp. NPDC058623]|uniref:hypothetical protein n=1 Tax=Streptomyces sp. NPDC058623 TaxID=3346563 RepID=UPI003657784F
MTQFTHSGGEVVGRTKDGRRVVALADNYGGHAEKAVVRKDLAIDVPEAVSDGQTLALIVQGLTAWHRSARADASPRANRS